MFDGNGCDAALFDGSGCDAAAVGNGCKFGSPATARLLEVKLRRLRLFAENSGEALLLPALSR